MHLYIHTHTHTHTHTHKYYSKKFGVILHFFKKTPKNEIFLHYFSTKRKNF